MNRYVIAAAAAFVSVPASASISTPVEPRLTERVAYRDLDLSSQRGRDALVNRIRTAANRVCAPEDFTYPYHRERKCYRTAVASGIAQMDAIAPASAAR